MAYHGVLLRVLLRSKNILSDLNFSNFPTRKDAECEVQCAVVGQ